MTNELFTSDGKRKYLNAVELAAFIKAAAQQDRAEVRTGYVDQNRLPVVSARNKLALQEGPSNDRTHY